MLIAGNSNAAGEGSSTFMVISIPVIILVYAFHALPAGHVTTPNTGKNSISPCSFFMLLKVFLFFFLGILNIAVFFFHQMCLMRKYIVIPTKSGFDLGLLYWYNAHLFNQLASRNTVYRKFLLLTLFF